MKVKHMKALQQQHWHQAVRAFHADERGTLMTANLFCVVFCVVLIVMTINNASITRQKIERQNAADAVTQSAGVCMARGMNAITATNHLIGEMLSLVILHEALGGQKLDNNQSAEKAGTRNRSRNAKTPDKIRTANTLLRIAYWAGRIANRTSPRLGPNRGPRKIVRDEKEIHSEACILDSKMNLKSAMTFVYGGFGTAGLLKRWKFTYLIGVALEAVMFACETKIAAEYVLLNAIRAISGQLVELKRLMRDHVITEAYYHTLDTRDKTPDVAIAVAQKIGQLNQCKTMLYPDAEGLRLPVFVDPLSAGKSFVPTHELVPANRKACKCPTKSGKRVDVKVRKVSQLARATFPWVNYHRQTVMDFFGRTLHFAGAKDLYQHWTTQYSKVLVMQLQDEEGPRIGLLVVDGYQAPDKGFEKWTLSEYSREADDLFTVMGTVRQDAASIVGHPLFSKMYKQGTFSWSMALLYNGNDQQRPEYRLHPNCNRVVPIRQANVGMDTLNWFPGSRQEKNSCETERGDGDVSARSGENRPFELIGRGLPGEYPRVRVNWQSKLVPTTAYRLSKLLQSDLPQDFKPLAKQVSASILPSINTH